MFSLKNIDERTGQQPVTNKNIKSTKSIQFRDTSEIFYVINNEQKENFNECCAIMWECIQLFSYSEQEIYLMLIWTDFDSNSFIQFPFFFYLNL